MAKLSNAEKAAKAVEKIVKGANKQFIAPISATAKQAGLDKLRSPNIFAEVQLASNPNKTVALTREQFAKELGKAYSITYQYDAPKRKTSNAAKFNQDQLLKALHPDLVDKSKGLYGTYGGAKLAERAVKLIENNPSASADDIGKVLNHHNFKDIVVGKFSENYLKHIVNTPKSERSIIHNFVKDITSSKPVKDSTTNEIEGVVNLATYDKVFPTLRRELNNGRIVGNYNKRDEKNVNWYKLKGHYISGKAVDTIIKIAKRKSKTLPDTESRQLFFTLLSDELKSPTGQTVDDILAMTKALM